MCKHSSVADPGKLARKRARKRQLVEAESFSVLAMIIK